MTAQATTAPEATKPEARPTVRRERVTWSRWDTRRRKTVTSHPWQYIVTEPDGYERCFDTRGAAGQWITDNYPPAEV